LKDGNFSFDVLSKIYEPEKPANISSDKEEAIKKYIEMYAGGQVSG